QVLIVGDRMAKNLEPYADALINNASKNMTEPLRLKFLAREGYGLHRTLETLKELPTLPRLVIYYGASQELFELRTHPIQYEDFLTNKQLLANEIVSSTLMAWPDFSRLIYNPYQYFNIRMNEEPKESASIGAGADKLKQLEMLYQIYEWELDELVRFTKSKNI